MKNKIKSWWTMKRGRVAFTDVISGEAVYHYTDCFGVKYLANYNPYFFRVKLDKA